MTTAGGVATAESFTKQLISCAMRLAGLSPDVLERLVLSREPSAISLLELIDTTYLPWAKAGFTAFGN